ncbi:hypothetical protein C4D60_Mb00t02650 [Musa balbisiana]|uniref:ATPase F1/V1/A1 complex alpha/beta subunit N-terminal domain-containing protein n=1 Tax=Musa balbisiana TaxID=52838 RepID=A0A4S8I792_MUSBA|nr:hypothetical protein C4D60_Mb00t02650 [Musa balbisiana]
MTRRYWNINLEEMMEAGVHFGHGTKKWNPRMAPYISAKRKGDGIARVHGLDEVMAGELVEFQEGTIGIALNLESNNVGVVLMGDGLMIQEGSSVKATGRIAQIPVSEGYLGRVINALAKPIDGRGEISASESRLIESPAPGSDYFPGKGGDGIYYCGSRNGGFTCYITIPRSLYRDAAFSAEFFMYRGHHTL